MTTVFVVLGEYGEYSDRDVFVSGVYENMADAQAAMRTAAMRRGIYKNWSQSVERHIQTLDRRGALSRRYLFNDEERIEFDAMMKEAERRAGPKPEYERAESTSLYEVPLGEWQKNLLDEISDDE